MIIKCMMWAFFVICMIICWLTTDLRQFTGLFAIALAITSIDEGGTDDE